MQESANRMASTIVTVGAMLGLVMGAACGGAAPEGGEAPESAAAQEVPEAQAASAPEDDSPEAAAYRYREGLMHAIAWKAGQVRGMAQEEIPPDDAAFTKNAGDLAALAGMISDGFIPDSIVAGSRALPPIWENWDDFVQRAQDLQAAAESVAGLAADGGFAAGQSAALDIGQNCGACHDSYREPNE